MQNTNKLFVRLRNRDKAKAQNLMAEHMEATPQHRIERCPPISALGTNGTMESSPPLRRHRRAVLKEEFWTDIHATQQ